MAKSIQAAWAEGRAYARGELERIDPQHELPGCTVLSENGFDAACYNQNTKQQLDLSEVRKADKCDCAEWGIRPTEWAEQIGMAYEALVWDRI